ncbi:polyprotein, partial [Maclura mosaic virus]
RAGMTQTRIRTTMEVLEDIQWGKAAGPLYAMKKRDLCKNLTEEELVALGAHCRSELNKGKNAGLWNGSLKAELRPKEKVDLNKTRVFTPAPITTPHCAKYFVDDFNKQFYKSHLKATSPLLALISSQNGWSKVYNKLNKDRLLHGSGDGSRFDSSIDPYLFDMIYTIRCHFMHEDDKRESERAMSNMFREFVFYSNSHDQWNILVKQVGNNSGQPSTVVDNTLVLMISFYYAYAVKTRDYTFDKIDERFVFVCNGDDNKFAVSPEFVKEFGGSFTDEIAQLGLHYEFDELTTDITANPYMSLTMIDIGGRIGFQLNPERILGIVQWIKKGGIVHAAQAAFAAMIESFNDPDLFCVMHSYLVWLLVTYRSELVYAMHNDLVSVVYMDPCQVFALHYNDSEDVREWFDEDDESSDDEDEEPTQVLQMDAETLAKDGEAKKEKDEKEREKAEQRRVEVEKARAEKAQVSDGAKEPQPEIKGNEDVEQPASDPEEKEEEVKWVMPSINPNRGSNAIPTVNGKKLWKRGILKHIPKQQYDASTTKATSAQLAAWVEAVKKDLKIRNDDAWSIVLTAWCIWCANNGTSSEVDTNQDMESDSLGKVQTVRIDSFVEPAIENGGLRKIMRLLFRYHSGNLGQRGKNDSLWNQAGFTEKAMTTLPFDFVEVTKTTPKTVKEQLAQAKIAAIGHGTRRAMVTDGSVHGNKTSYERHVDTDNDESEHGKDIDYRPHLS